MEGSHSQVSVDSSQQLQHTCSASILDTVALPFARGTPEARHAMNGTSATPTPFALADDPSRVVSVDASSQNQPTPSPSSCVNGGVESSGNGLGRESMAMPTEPPTSLGKRKRKARHDDHFCFVSDGSHRTSSHDAAPSDPCSSNGTGEGASASKRRRQKTTEEEFDTVWICSECKEAECFLKPEADTLLICDGKCRRVFHYPCVGLLTLPSESDAFYCPDCVQCRHRCAICQDYGVDDDDVFCCSKANCGLFFHSACLAMQNVDVHSDAVDDASSSDDPESLNGSVVGQGHGHPPSEAVSSSGGVVPSNREKIRFVCPAHNCWTCTQLDFKQQELDALQAQRSNKPGSRKAKGKGKSASVFDAKSERYLIRCIECPISYHVTCIPPMARFHELALLCHRDASRFKLPFLDPASSIQERLERKASEKFGDYKMKRQKTSSAKGDNKFFPGLRGDKPTKCEAALVQEIKKRHDGIGFVGSNGQPPLNALALTEGFCLPCNVQSEVYSVPPQYRHVTANQIDPTNRPTKISMNSEMCQCVNFCGDDCLNRMLYIECFGSGDRGRCNCRVGPRCGNRVISQRKSAKCKPQREQGKGWGLVTSQKILRGDFVQEYMGEVIHEKEKEKRLSDWSTLRPNDHNFYVMSLCPDWYVDARLLGNFARFINHSCDPNCVLLQINVGGYMRCGIFAKRDIHPGEFLSYDYNFDTRSDRFVCRCGALKCRGNMKNIAGKDVAMVEKSKAEAWDDAKAKYERDKKFLTDHFEMEAKRCNLVGVLVPDAEGPHELVSNGVQARYRGDVLRSRPFLWRNAVRGSDFASRVARADRRKKRLQATPT